MEKIKNIKAIQFLDSRTAETIQLEIETENFKAVAAIPQGKSTGKYEAIFLPAKEAIENIENKIKPILIGKEPDFKVFDEEMIRLDGTNTKSNLGANAILAVSLATARLQANIEGKPPYNFLSQFFSKNFQTKKAGNPVLLMNLINGGLHAAAGPEIQEYLILVNEKSPKESVNLGAGTYRKLGKILKCNIGDEGGYVPREKDNEFPLEVISKILKEKGVQDKVGLGLDVAASGFFENEKYKIGGKKLSKNEFLDFYFKLTDKFDLKLIEDPFSEDDPKSFGKLLLEKSGLIVVGDDLTVTNLERLKDAKEKNLISGIIVKVNQIGSLSETIDVINYAKKNEIKVIISHRSGETNDAFISDLAVASGAWGLKAGAPARGERVAKYNRLIEIEEEKNN